VLETELLDPPPAVVGDVVRTKDHRQHQSPDDRTGEAEQEPSGKARWWRSPATPPGLRCGAATLP
jgi:hypothetical protein